MKILKIEPCAKYQMLKVNWISTDEKEEACRDTMKREDEGQDDDEDKYGDDNVVAMVHAA